METNLASLRLIRRHDLPMRFGKELFEAKVEHLLLTVSVYFFLSRECRESLLLFQDKLRPVEGEESISELEHESISRLLTWKLLKVSFLFSESLLTLESLKTVSWSEFESKASEASLIPLLSKMARTSAVAFSAFFLCKDTSFNCSSSSTTYTFMIFRQKTKI